MTANLRILSPNLSDQATLSTVTSFVSTLPVENLQDQTRKVARSTGTSFVHVKGDWSSAQEVSAMALVGHNLSPTAQIQFWLYSGTGLTGAQLYNSGTSAGMFSSWAPTIYTVLWFSPVSGVRSFDLEIMDSANPAGYVEARRLFIGKYFEPVKNFDYGYDMQWREKTTQERTDGNSIRSDPRDPYRRWTCALPMLTATERGKLSEIFRTQGLRNDMFISFFAGQGGQKEVDYSGLAKIVEMPNMPNDFFGNWRTSLVFEET